MALSGLGSVQDLLKIPYRYLELCSKALKDEDNAKLLSMKLRGES